MDINKMLDQLQAEQEQLEQAIFVLERIAADAVNVLVVHRFWMTETKGKTTGK